MSLPVTSKAKIIAVSKLQPAEKIRALYSQGQIDFAENYAQEAGAKMETLKDLPLRWHFIGHLQKNKIKLVVGKFALIHSVDSLELAQAINKQAEKLNLIQKILLQINLAGQESKEGFAKDSFNKSLEEIVTLKNLQVCGLMTMPPLDKNPEQVRPYFHELRQIRDQWLPRVPSMQELSMGTSGDYQVAEQEGATMVRLGTILFGERPKKD